MAARHGVMAPGGCVPDEPVRAEVAPYDLGRAIRAAMRPARVWVWPQDAVGPRFGLLDDENGVAYLRAEGPKGEQL